MKNGVNEAQPLRRPQQLEHPSMHQPTSFLLKATIGAVIAAIVIGILARSYGTALLIGLGACIIINLSILLATLKAPDKLVQAKAIWVSVGALVLVSAFLFVDKNHPEAQHDLGDIIGYPVGILSFPLGVFGYVATDIICDFKPRSLYGAAFFNWALMMSLGYLQWFILLPKILQSLSSLSKR